MVVSLALGLAVAAMAPAETCVAAPAAGHEGARALAWFINNEKLTIRKTNYVKYGLPRVLAKGDVELFAPYKGGFAYVETGVKAPSPDVLYVLVDLNGCEFQPYQVEPK